MTARHALYVRTRWRFSDETEAAASSVAAIPCFRVKHSVITAMLTQRLANRSNLAELCQSTSMEFGGDPPLFSKPPGWTPDLMTAAATHEPPPRPSYSPPPPQPSAEEFQENPLNPSPSRYL